MNEKQIRELLIKPILTEMKMYSKEAEDLVWGTGQQESHWDYIRQVGVKDGVGAYGVMQIELKTYEFLTQYIHRKGGRLLKLFNKYRNESLMITEDLISNLALNIFLCRVLYWTKPEAIPSDLDGQAKYWKKYYNTIHGAGTPGEYIRNYEA